jgi:methyl-accepting chemotaxis protein
LSDVPAATVVHDGKLGGDVPSGKPPKHKRRLSNYLIDKSLQLRYILLVTILSGMIAGSLGYLIFEQRHAASQSLESDLAELTQNDASFADLQKQEAERFESEDRMLVYQMIGFGCGLVLILSAYLLIMTHKVAGPLYKVSHYFDQMAAGKLGNVTALRKGDMLQDFFVAFREMHESVRKRFQGDLAAMEKAMAALRTAGHTSGESHDKLLAELDAAAKHLDTRKQALS